MQLREGHGHRCPVPAAARLLAARSLPQEPGARADGPPRHRHQPRRLPLRATGASTGAAAPRTQPWFYYAAKRFVRQLKHQEATNASALSEGRKVIVKAYDSEGRQLDPPKTMSSASSLSLHVPLEATVAFHHVKPTARSPSYRPDPRCGVRLKAKNAAHVGWWSSRCLPYFFVVGAPKAGTTSLFAWLAQVQSPTDLPSALPASCPTRAFATCPSDHLAV